MKIKFPTHSLVSSILPTASVALAAAFSGMAQAEPIKAKKNSDIEIIYDLSVETDIQDLKKDSLYLDAISRPDRYRNEAFGSSYDRFRPNGIDTLGRYRPNLQGGIGAHISGEVENRFSRFADDFSQFVMGTEGTYYRADGDFQVTVLMLDSELLEKLFPVTNGYTEEERAADISLWVSVHYDDGNNLHTWVSSNIYETTSDPDGAIDLAGWAAVEAEEKHRQEQEEDEREALGGNDNYEKGGGELDPNRPIFVSDTDGTLRVLDQDMVAILGALLEGEPGNSNEGQGTIRVSADVQERIKSSRAEDYNGKLAAELEDLFNGGGGVDPTWGGDPEGATGTLSGNVGGGKL